jgi:hypothetical protein
MILDLKAAWITNFFHSDPEALSRYIPGGSSGQLTPLKFTFYIPAGYDNAAGLKVPNVEVATNPAKILTASFAGGQEVRSARAPKL